MKLSEIEQLARREILDEIGVEKIRLVKSWQMKLYINEAIDEVCMRSRCLIDSVTPEICTIQIVAGQSVYNYDPRILRIIRGKISAAAAPLQRIGFSTLDSIVYDWEAEEGNVIAFVTGMDKGKLRLYKKPIRDEILNLSVVRLPLSELNNDTDTAEIHDRLCNGLVLWIKHKIYNNQDSELFDKNRADVHLQAFENKYGAAQKEFVDVFDSMEIQEYTQFESNNLCSNYGYAF